MANKKGVMFVDLTDEIRQIIPGPFVEKLKGFDDYFQSALYNVTENLAKSGVTVAQRTLRNAKTEWGKSRMAGNHFGVRFAPYGRSEGREDTGFMYDSLSYSVDFAISGWNVWKGSFGWDDSVVSQAPYIKDQENGFMSFMRFDPVATAKNGKARFREGRSKWIPGAQSLPAATESVRKRMASAYSAAWNEAVKVWESSGNSSPGSYMQARRKYVEERTRRFQRR